MVELIAFATQALLPLLTSVAGLTTGFLLVIYISIAIFKFFSQAI